METAAIIALALAVVGFGGTAIGLALRNGALVAEVATLRASSGNAEKQLSVTAAEFAEYKRRTDGQLAAAETEAKELRDDLEKCSAPGSQRARLDGLLAKLAARANTAGVARRTGPLPSDATAIANGAHLDDAVPGGKPGA